jgi:hypothetical protein
MANGRRQKTIYVLFVISLIWGCYHLFFNKEESRNERTQVVESAITLPSPPAVSAGDTGAQFDEWGEDPFVRRQAREAVAPTADKDRFRLSAISEANGVFWAVINRRAVRSGDRLGDWKVVRIEGTRAVLERNGETVSVSMEGD